MQMPVARKHSSIISSKIICRILILVRSLTLSPIAWHLYHHRGISNVTVDLINISGKTLMSGKQLVYAGTNSIHLDNTQTLPSGIYN